MRRIRRTIAVAALLATACGGPAADDAADNARARDSALPDTLVPPAGAQAPPTAGPDTPDAAAPGRSVAPAPRAPDAGEPPAAQPEAPERAASIPARFHGEWNADLDACGTGASESRLRISADRVRFYESAGVVRSVEVVSSRVIDVRAEYQGEGETWQDERRFALSQDGNSLTVSNGGSLVRYRCP